MMTTVNLRKAAESFLPAIIFRTPLLPRNRNIKGALLLRMIALESSTQASTNMPEALLLYMF